MTCAKKTVECVIATKDGSFFYGQNSCDNPQKTCPRKNGEGYEKCKTICNQWGHAEEMAIKEANDYGASLIGATAHVKGIRHYCKSCQHKLINEGISSLHFI